MDADTLYRCYICDMFTAFYDFGMHYGQNLYQSLLAPMRILFLSYVGLWVAWYLVFKGIMKSVFNPGYFFKMLLFFIFIEYLLQGSDFFWTHFHTPFLSLISSLAQQCISLGRVSLKDSTFEGILYTLDHTLHKTVFHVWNILIGEAGWLSWKPLMAAFILIIPYLLVTCLFLAFLLEFVFSVMIVTAICPLLFITLSFKILRGIALSALRIALQGSLTLLFSSIAMGFTLEIFNQFSPLIPSDPANISVYVEEFIFSSHYWAIWILGFLSVFFHIKAASFAKQISYFSYTSQGASSFLEDSITLKPLSNF